MSAKTELTREKVLETIGVLALACLVVGHLAQRPGVKSGFLGAAALLLALGLFVNPAGALIVLTSGSAVAPFIYTLF